MKTHKCLCAPELLWTAPEILRMPGQPGVHGTHPADVYSFAIIMQEVVMRAPPFCMLDLPAAGQQKTMAAFLGVLYYTIATIGNLQQLVITPVIFCVLEIIEKIRKPPPLFRPPVSPDCAPLECIQLMKQCWNEQPEKRPNFEDIFDQVG